MLQRTRANDQETGVIPRSSRRLRNELLDLCLRQDIREPLLALRSGERMQRILRHTPLPHPESVEGAECGEPLLHGVPGDRKPVTFVEDTAVDPAKLPGFIKEFKAIRALLPEAKVNDVAIAVIGGALNKYLSAKGDLPKTTMTAMAMRRPELKPSVSSVSGPTWPR